MDIFVSKEKIEEWKSDTGAMVYETTYELLTYVENIQRIFPLYTKQALAERWGVSRQTVNNWAARHTDFPKPIEGLVMGNGPYYPLYEVERYEKTRGLNK